MRIAAQDAPKPRRHQSAGQVILFSVSRQTFAIAAGAVREIRDTDSLAGAAVEMEQTRVPKVRHTVERAHRTYFVVNACLHFHLPVSRPSLVLVLRELRAAVLVDRIERMVEIAAVYPLPGAFQGEERQWYRGLAYLDDCVIPVLQPSGFLSPAEFRWLDSSARASASRRELEGAARA
ncbi:MAG TPA: chemotaxis protein CheW [Candidatus Acidoferrales bacterium]|nr:chemotaxis protein CheW [Candidatus Acidoferrales bacterium]